MFSSIKLNRISIDCSIRTRCLLGKINIKPMCTQRRVVYEENFGESKRKINNFFRIIDMFLRYVSVYYTMSKGSLVCRQVFVLFITTF